MKKKNGFINISFTLAIVMGMSCFYSIKAASSSLSLTKEQAVEMALETSSQMARVDTAIAAVNRNIDKYNELSSEADDLEENFKQYQEGYNEANSEENKAKFQQLQAIKAAYLQADAIPDEAARNASLAYIYSQCGYTEAQIDTMLQSIKANMDKLNAAGEQFKEAGLADESLAPKSLTSQKYYDTFIYPQVMPPIIARDMLGKAKLQKKVVACVIDMKVREAYDDILYANDGLSLMEKLYNTQLNEYNQLLIKYQQGLCSEVEKNIAGMEIKKSKLKLDNLQRQVQNGKYKFNQALGVDIETSYSFTDSKLSYSAPMPYSQYLNSAMENRAEIQAAQIDIDEKEKNLALASQHFSEGDYTYIKADKDLAKVRSNYNNICKNIEMEMKKSYLDVKQKQSAKNLADAKLKQADIQYKKAKNSYDAGVINISVLWNAELLVNKAEMNASKSLRDYNNALYELRQNSNIGTEYVMEGA